MDIIAQGPEFYVQNIFNDSTTVIAKGYPDISTWSDLEFANTKSGWESLGIVSSSLLSGTKYDHMGNQYPIKQVEIDVDSDEFQDWYLTFTRFLQAAIINAQQKNSEILNKHFG
jgi:hypothetical protein